MDFTPIVVQGPTVYQGPFNVYNSAGTFVGVTSTPSWISASSYIYNSYGTNGQFAVDETPAGPYLDTNNFLNGIAAFQQGGYSTPLQNLRAAEAIAPVNNLSTTLNLSFTTEQYSFGPNDVVTFELQQALTCSSTNFTASISTVSNLGVIQTSLEGSYAYLSASEGTYIKSFANSGSYGVVTLTGSFGPFLGSYQQVPYFVSGGVTYSSSLYNKYGDVNTLFAPQPSDKLILKDVNNIVQNLDIYSSSLSGSQNCVQLFTVPTITTTWVNNSALVETFLLLRRYQDEQNVIMTFNKPSGETSYGFIIPETISPEVVNNINTLQANVQAQLLSTQASANISTL